MILVQSGHGRRWKKQNVSTMVENCAECADIRNTTSRGAWSCSSQAMADSGLWYVPTCRLVLVDYGSKFTGVNHLESMDGHCVIGNTKSRFCQLGDTSDSGKWQRIAILQSAVQKLFENLHGYLNTQHRRPDIQKQMEWQKKSVQTVKCKETVHKRREKRWLSLSSFARSSQTPVADCRSTPVQILQSRRMRTNTPTAPRLLEPQLVDDSIQ